MKIVKVLGAVVLASVVFSCGKQGSSKKSLKTEMDSISYALGMSVASNIGTTFEGIDNDLLFQAYSSVSDSTATLLEKSEVDQLIQAYFQKNQVKIQARQKAAAELAAKEAAKAAELKYAESKAAGVKFLEENKTKEGVKVTESGLQYVVMNEGSGDKPTAASKVKVHYHGTLIDGTVFDSSVDRGQPAEFGVGQVIPGWTEGLQLMSVGSKYKFFIPQELGYGANPRPGVIKPFDALVFEVELLEIK